MKIANNINILSKYEYQVFCHHNHQFFFKQFQQNESSKSNVEIDQTQGWKIMIRKEYYEEEQEENWEFTLIEKNKLKKHISETRHEISYRIHQ